LSLQSWSSQLFRGHCLTKCPKSELRPRTIGSSTDRDLSERKSLCSAHGPSNGSWLSGVDILRGRHVGGEVSQALCIVRTRNSYRQTQVPIAPSSNILLDVIFKLVFVERCIVIIGLKKPTITNLIGQIHKNTTLK